MIKNYTIYQGKLYCHPGFYLSELIKSKAYSREEIKDILDVSDEELENLLKGNVPLVFDQSRKLALDLHTSLAYWVNMQNTFDTVVEKISRERGENDDQC